MTEPKKFLLDSLIPERERAKLVAARNRKPGRPKKHDLRELFPRKEPIPDLDELLPPHRVVLYVQENVCDTCGSITRLPLGLIGMQMLIRNKHRTGIESGIPLQRNNAYPALERELNITRTSSMVCCACANEARMLPQPEPLHAPQMGTLDYRPKPSDPEWHEKSGFATNESIRAHAERIAQAEEKNRVELRPVSVPEARYIPDSEEE